MDKVLDRIREITKTPNLEPQARIQLSQAKLVQSDWEEVFWNLLHWPTGPLKQVRGLVLCLDPLHCIVDAALKEMNASRSERATVFAKFQDFSKTIRNAATTFHNFKLQPLKEDRSTRLLRLATEAFRASPQVFRCIPLAILLAALKIMDNLDQRAKTNPQYYNRAEGRKDYDMAVLVKVVKYYPLDKIFLQADFLHLVADYCWEAIDRAEEAGDFINGEVTATQYKRQLLQDLFGKEIPNIKEPDLNRAPGRPNLGRKTPMHLVLPPRRKWEDRLKRGENIYESANLTYDIQSIDPSMATCPETFQIMEEERQCHLRSRSNFRSGYNQIQLNEYSLWFYDLLTSPDSELSPPLRASLILIFFLGGILGNNTKRIINLKVSSYEEICRMDPTLLLEDGGQLFFDHSHYWLIIPVQPDYLAKPDSYITKDEKNFFPKSDRLFVLSPPRYPFLTRAVDTLLPENFQETSKGYHLLHVQSSTKPREFTRQDLSEYFQTLARKYGIVISDNKFASSVFTNFLDYDVDPVVASYFSLQIPQEIRSELSYNRLNLRREISAVVMAINNFLSDIIENSHALDLAQPPTKEQILGQDTSFCFPPDLSVGSIIHPPTDWLEHLFPTFRQLVDEEAAKLLRFALFTIHNFFATLFLTAARESEIENSQTKDITEHLRLLTIHGEPNSYMRRSRQISICDTLDQILHNQIEATNKIAQELNCETIPYIFPLPNFKGKLIPIDPASIDLILQRYKKRLGIFPKAHNFTRHITINRLRQTHFGWIPRLIIDGHMPEDCDPFHLFCGLYMPPIYEAYKDFAEKVARDFKIIPIKWR